MKTFNAYIVIATIFVLSSCQTSEKPAKQTSHAMNIELSATEQKSYQDALDAFKAGRADSAISALSKITNNHPDHVGAWINLANGYLSTKKVNDAEAALAHVTSVKPAIAEALNLQGLIDVEKGDYTKAEKNYLAALELKENYALAHYNIALLYDVFYQAPAQAIPHYERYLALSGDNDKNTKNWLADLKQKMAKRNKQ